MKPTPRLLAIVLAFPLLLVAGCGKNSADASASAKPHKHEHHPPHGGTPVVLGDEVYHLELVRDPAAGKLQAFVLDGEMENFIRSAAPSFEIDATVDGAPQVLVLKATANPATGETVGDSALFEAQADWLKTANDFDATMKSIAIRGTTFADVKFNFPKGNDTD